LLPGGILRNNTKSLACSPQHLHTTLAPKTWSLIRTTRRGFAIPTRYTPEEDAFYSSTTIYLKNEESGADIFVTGTGSLRFTSVNQIKHLIRSMKPDTVMIGLDQERGERIRQEIQNQPANPQIGMLDLLNIAFFPQKQENTLVETFKTSIKEALSVGADVTYISGGAARYLRNIPILNSENFSTLPNEVKTEMLKHAFLRDAVLIHTLRTCTGRTIVGVVESVHLEGSYSFSFSDSTIQCWTLVNSLVPSNLTQISTNIWITQLFGT